MQAIKRILIANRGEIARRIIRTAKRQGISTFAVYTPEEENALHVLEADYAASLGPGNLAESYLNLSLIIRIAQENHCDAIHPGYGFLAENAGFSEACQAAGIIFIGPDPDAIRLMGNKNEARKYVEGLGIPLLNSISGLSLIEVQAKVKKMKFPFILKAVAGGGGKGMKIIHSYDEIADAWEPASRQAMSYFGNPALYLEQYIEDARHIEVQVLGDRHGNVVHLYERECTIQRRHQKIIEEAPSPTLPNAVRKKLLDAAFFIAGSMKYSSAGTLEFLFDKDLNFYFLEMNTRIQVEHPVTEAITGIDIVLEQIRIAEGSPLSFAQKDVKVNGHAIECRIYAEDPYAGFVPSSGKMLLNQMPASEEVRIDSAYEGPAFVSSLFDPMIAKATAHAVNRNDAIAKLRKYLKTCSVQGIKTNLEYLIEILDEEDYNNNHISTCYCELHATKLFKRLDVKRKLVSKEKLIAFALIKSFSGVRREQNTSIWQKLGPWRNFGSRIYSIDSVKYEIVYQLLGKTRIGFLIDETNYLIEGIENQEPRFSFHLNGEKHTSMITGEEGEKLNISYQSLSFSLIRLDVPDVTILGRNGRNANHSNGNNVISPLNGKIVKLNVRKGDKVKKGELLLVIESMKMENKVLAPAEAEVLEVMVASGDQVIGSELLIKLTMLN